MSNNLIQRKKQPLFVLLFLSGILFFSPSVRATIVDSDQDGLSDSAEINIYHTDPHDADTDRDSVPDGQEILENTNPTNDQDSTERSLTEREMTLQKQFLRFFIPLAAITLILLTTLIIRVTLKSPNIEPADQNPPVSPPVSE